MSCKNCDDKPKRYSTTTVSPLMAAPEEVQAPPSERSSRDPYTAFQEAQSMSYKEIISRLNASREDRLKREEEAMSMMSPDMKRVHIETLISIFNGDSNDIMGMSPNQAITSLYKLLNQADFSFILNIYPFLLNQVRDKYNELKKNKIQLVADR